MGRTTNPKTNLTTYNRTNLKTMSSQTATVAPTPTPAPAPECDVCCRKFTKVTRTPVPCSSPDCDFAACSMCVKAYLLGQTQAKCMNCEATWTRGHVATHLGVKWTKNNLLKEQANVMLSQELARLPDDMEEAAFVKRVAEHRVKVKERRAKLRELNNLHAEFLRTGVVTREFATAIHHPWFYGGEALQIEVVTAYMAQRDSLNRRLLRCLYDVPERPRQTGTGTETKADVVRAKCPVGDCRGFANEKWDCGVCGVKICPECHEESADGHACDPNVLENIKLLAADTKPCPTCQTPIHKISGCDQMWCVKCRTAFSWETGRIEKGLIHNPHFYQWRTANPNGDVRNVGDVACGGVLGNREINNFVNGVLRMMGALSAATLDESTGKISTDKAMVFARTKCALQLDKLCQLIIGFNWFAEMIQRELDDCRALANTAEERLRKMRVDFINKDTKTETAYRNKLMKHITVSNRNAEMMSVMEMLTTCLIERVRGICSDERVASTSSIWLLLTNFLNPEKSGRKGSRELKKACGRVFPMAGRMATARRDLDTKVDFAGGWQWATNLWFVDADRQPVETPDLRERHLEADAVEMFVADAQKVIGEMTEIANYAKAVLDKIGKDYDCEDAMPPFEISLKANMDVSADLVADFAKHAVILPNTDYDTQILVHYLSTTGIVRAAGLRV